MGRDKNRLVALTGVAFLVIGLISFMIGGEPPDPTKDSAKEIVDFYVDKDSTLMVGAFLEGLAAAMLVFFGSYLRDALSAAEPRGQHFLSTAAFAGTLIIAIGFTIDATISLTLAETAKDIEPAAAEALSALFNNDYIPFAVGSVIFLLAMGISVLRHGVLPKVIGFLAILLAVIGFTPIGFVAFIGAGILIAVIGVILAMRGGAEPPATPVGDGGVR